MHTLVNKITKVSRVYFLLHHLYTVLCVHQPKSGLLPSPFTPPFTLSYLPPPPFIWISFVKFLFKSFTHSFMGFFSLIWSSSPILGSICCKYFFHWMACSSLLYKFGKSGWPVGTAPITAPSPPFPPCLPEQEVPGPCPGWPCPQRREGDGGWLHPEGVSGAPGQGRGRGVKGMGPRELKGPSPRQHLGPGREAPTDRCRGRTRAQGLGWGPGSEPAFVSDSQSRSAGPRHPLGLALTGP